MPRVICSCNWSLCVLIEKHIIERWASLASLKPHISQSLSVSWYCNIIADLSRTLKCALTRLNSTGRSSTWLSAGSLTYISKVSITHTQLYMYTISYLYNKGFACMCVYVDIYLYSFHHVTRLVCRAKCVRASALYSLWIFDYIFCHDNGSFDNARAIVYISDVQAR